MFVGEYFVEHYRGHFYAKAQNLCAPAAAAYDDVLARYDLLLMPTTPMKATPLPPPDAPLALSCQRAFEMLPNTSPVRRHRPPRDEHPLRHVATACRSA